MGFLNWLGLGKVIAEPIEAASKFVTTDKDRILAQSQLMSATQSAEVERLKTNEILAQSAKFYNSGWIATTGWTTGAMMILYWLPQLLVADYVWIGNCLATHTVLPFPISSNDIMQLVFLMFGGFSFHYLGKKVS